MMANAIPKGRNEVYPMEMDFYLRDPKLWPYFASLPSPVRAALLQNDVCVGTLGELQTMAEHYRNEMELS